MSSPCSIAGVMSTEIPKSLPRQKTPDLCEEISPIQNKEAATLTYDSHKVETKVVSKCYWSTPSFLLTFVNLSLNSLILESVFCISLILGLDIFSQIVAEETWAVQVCIGGYNLLLDFLEAFCYSFILLCRWCFRRLLQLRFPDSYEALGWHGFFCQ